MAFTAGQRSNPQQWVEADERGASEGRSPLNPVFDRHEMVRSDAVKLRESLPIFYAELENGLREGSLTALLDQLPELEILDQCDCDEAGYATFRVKAARAKCRGAERDRRAA